MAIRSALESNEWILSEYGTLRPTRKVISEWKEALVAKGIDPESISKPEWSRSMLRTAKCLMAEVEAGQRFKEPNVTAQGMNESTTGSHFNVIILDDPVTERSAKSVALKEKAISVYHDLMSQLEPTGLFWDIGTRHAEDDIHAVIQEKYADDYTIEVHTCWGDGEELTREDFERGEDGKYHCKRPLDEVKVFWEGYGSLSEEVSRGERFPAEERKRRALEYLGYKMHSMPAQRWANQFLNRCVAVEDQIFFDWMFKTYRPHQVQQPLRHYVLTDSATGKDFRSSYRVVAVVGMDSSRCAYVRDLEFGRWSPDEYCKKILHAYWRWGARYILMERVAWQEAFKSVMELVSDQMRDRDGSLGPPRVFDIPGRSLISKLERIEGLEPRLRNGRMLFDPGLKGKTCEGKDVWTEMVAQFKRVHELAVVAHQGVLLVDIPDALSDVDAMTAKGRYICRGPHRRAQALQEHPGLTEAEFMEPLQERRRKALERAGQEARRRVSSGLWGNRPTRRSGGGLWD